ncbi:MAG: response regulator [Gammaproteobacteria bacterium]|nr:response regulator [Gammaproteobacteria bacterium]
MIRVMLVDDRNLMRSALKRLIEEDGNIRVGAEVPDGESAIAVARGRGVDVAVVDTGVRNPGILETTRRLGRADEKLKILALGDPDCAPLPSRFL